jgi:hypothetical protein
MLAASAVGIFLIPMLYVTFQTGRERIKTRLGMAEPSLPGKTEANL